MEAELVLNRWKGESAVAVGRRAEEAVVGRGLLGRLPDPLDGVELGGVGREAEELDAVMVGREPLLADLVEAVAGPVVDDEDDLTAEAADEMPEEFQ
jgi:hypothetical protein